MEDLITPEQLADLKNFIGHFNRKNSYKVISMLYKHPEGLTASKIEETLSVQQSEISSTLRLLYRHGFAKVQREGKFIRYFAKYEKFQKLFSLYVYIKLNAHGRKI